MTEIKFQTKLVDINGWTILHLPVEASVKLPSRGMIMVSGAMNSIPFKTLLEPDGKYGKELKPSHWFQPDAKLLIDAHAKAGDSVSVEIEPTKEWIEPEIPADMQKALGSSSKAQEIWNGTTPLAHWDWVRWVRAVKTQKTRKKHVEVMMDKLNRGTRRPCCFNRNMCSVPEVSKNWALLDPVS